MVCLLIATGTAFAHQPAEPASQINPGELVRKAVQNEIKVSSDSPVHFMFISTKTTPKGSITRMYVETREGTAGMTIATDGKPLSAQQRQAEAARLDRFLQHPEDLQKKRAREREDTDRTLKIMRAIPDAFLFEYAGEEKGSPEIGRIGDPLVKLKFHPNPRYQPPSRVEQVLTGMQGFVLVDADQYRLASIDGTLFKDVSFGWGFFGHLDHGGHFLVHQENVGDHGWEVSRMSLDFTGKILLLKNLTINSNEVFSGFKPVPADLTFVQAVELLKKDGPTMAENVSAKPAEK